MMETCILCKSSKKDDLQYGDFLKNKHFGVHTFCLYLSSNLPQRGDDDEGILGFLEKDIRKEVKRVSLLKCCYCSKMHANIGCCNKKCRRTFHLICGIEHGAQNQFSHEFQSYCRMHVKEETQRPSTNETCLICYERLCAAGKRFDKVNMILTPCCRNGWFHKLCLQMSAKTAGYFFKCPLCNDTKTFREKLPAKGVYIPNRDAAWELEPNAFAELLERPNECAAERCKHSQGRNASSDNNPFVMCSTCGSTAMHKKCLPSGGQQFHCNDCTVALEENDSGRDSLNLRVNQNDTECEFVDVCHVSDKEDLQIIERLVETNNKMGENKRDSGIQQTNADSNDEEVFHVTRHRNKTKKIRDSSEESTHSYNTGCDYDNKPQKRKSSTDSDRFPLAHPLKSRRIRSDTESSKDTLNGDGFFRVVKDGKIRIRSDTESSKDTLESENIPRVTRSIKRRIEIGLESSPDTSGDEDMPQVSRTRKTRIRGENNYNKNILHQEEELPHGSKCKKSTDDTVEEKEIPSRSNNNDARRLKPKSESSETEELQKPKLRNRNNLKFFDDSDDSEEEVVPSPRKKNKLMHSVNETYQKEKNIDDNISRKLSASTDERDSDDPLDNFFKYKVKQNNICSNTNLNKSQDLAKKENEGRNVSGSQGREKTKRSKFVPLKSAKNSCAKDNNLDISCIAKRTRRKTISGNSNNLENEKKENPLNISCIAKRTRRKTICAQTNYSRETLCEASQVFEKTHKSDEEAIMLTDDDSENKEASTETDLDGFIVDDGYEEKDRNFDISCVANRTRKRQSLKANRQHLQRIDEIVDCSSDSSNNLNWCNVNLRRRCKRHIYSNDDENAKTPSTLLKSPLSNSNSKIKKSSHLWLDKLPQHNYTAFLRTNCTPQPSRPNAR